MESDISLVSLFFTTILQIYIILNPPCVIAVMLGMTHRNTIAERLAISKQVCAVGGALLFTFALFGQIILDNIFCISPEAFQMGGGFYLFTIGINILLSESSNDSNDNSTQTEKSAFDFVITPLATPLLTGPGTITATLVKRTQISNSFPCLITFYGALIVTFILVYFSFYLGCKFSEYIKPSILKIVEKLVGMLLLCIAVSSILGGAITFFRNL